MVWPIINKSFELELFKIQTDDLKESKLDITENLNNNLSKMTKSDNYYFLYPINQYGIINNE